MWRHPWHLIWIAMAYVPFLGMMSVPLTGDQKVYLNISMEMREAGSWLRPLLFGEGSYYKPPLQYWATLVGWKLLGFNFWGALVPSVIAALLTAWCLGEIAALLREKRTASHGGLWFAATLSTVTYGTTAQMEIYVVLFYAAAWWAGLSYLARPVSGRRVLWLYLAFAIAGISALVKSPLYSVFWVVGYLFYLITSGEWELFRNRHLYLAWFLGVVLGASWFAYILAIDGQRFWAHYVVQETWDKKAGNGSTALQLWWALLYFCFPFTFLLFPALWVLIKGRKTGRLMRFFLCWALPPAIFFSLYPYRIKPYLYILVPALALMIDWGHARVGKSPLFRAFMTLSGGAFLGVTAAVGAVLYWAELVPVALSAGLVAAGVIGLFCAFRDRIHGFAMAALLAILCFRGAAVSLGEQDIAGLRAAVAARPESPIGLLDEHRNIWHEVGLLSTAIGRPIARLSNADELAQFLRDGGTVALSSEQMQETFRSVEAKLLGQQEMREPVTSSWKRWQVRGKFPFRELVLHGRAGVANFDGIFQREFTIIHL